jgi:hypothetical protein
MILASHGLIASQIASFDADALAFFQRVSDATGTLSLTEKQAVNQLVLDLKANSLWTPMKAIYPMVGASAAACAQNLKSSSFTGTFTATGWTFASTGVTGNGTSGYFSIPVNPSVNFPNSMTIGAYLNTSYTINGGFPMIYNSEGSGYNYWGGSNWNESYMGIVATLLNHTVTRTGFFNRRARVGEQRAWKNSSLVASSIINYTPVNNTFQVPQNASYAFHNSSYAMILMGDFISDTLSTNLYTAVQAFQTTLNRQVV